MGYTKAYEVKLLEPIEGLLRRICEARQDDPNVSRRLLVQAAAARLGGLPFYQLLSTLEEEASGPLASFAWIHSERVAVALKELPIPPPLAVASLMRSDLDDIARRRSGSYLTDFRLSTFLMRRLAARVPPGARVVDPAVGTGSFLVAFALEASRAWTKPISEIVSSCLYGADLSAEAVRGAICALAAAGCHAGSLELVKSHLRVADSLAQGKELWTDFPEGFDGVVGNPPWEKLKLSRHEYLRGLGVERHYGDIYDVPEHMDSWDEMLTHLRSSLDEYKRSLRSRYAMQGNGEDDLYKLFVELSLALAKPRGGLISMLLPAGLIRSSGAETLRRYLFWAAKELELTVFFNRACFFEIDTRFKFLAMEAETGAGLYRPIRLHIGAADACSAFSTSHVAIDRSALATIRADLAIPEVRSEAEWAMFQHMYTVACPFGSAESLWKPHIVREVDMTRDRPHFSLRPGPSMLPIIEGRMIHQHQHNAKAYLNGTGRAAEWLPLASEHACEIRSQFWFPEENLKEDIRRRVHQTRVGFCDVTGQTNERTLLAAPIPAGMVCGNKVPTITFADDPKWLQWAWLAYANSFLLDWVLRRMTTTSVNYFIIRSLPLPSSASSVDQNHTLASLAKRLACPSHFEGGEATRLLPLEVAEIRAEIEWRVLEAYGFDASALGIVLADFALLDRGEPPLQGESRSTVTTDFVALRAMQNLGGKPQLRGRLATVDELEERVGVALARGAVAFRPSQLAIAIRSQRKQVRSNSECRSSHNTIGLQYLG